jgi:long-chain fatty acid transport protein
MALILAPSLALAGNNFTFLVGGRAAGMGGAYTAMSDEASVAWYNPAGLGFNDRHSLDVSASAFHLQALRVPGFVSTRLDTVHVQPFDLTGFQVVPTSLTYVYRVGGAQAAPPPTVDGTSPPPDPEDAQAHSVAFSVIVPSSGRFSNDVVLDADVVDPASLASARYHHRLHFQQEGALYEVGPSWGMRINRYVSVGASLFVGYSSSTSRRTYALDTLYGGVDTFGVFTGERSMTEIGLQTMLGVQVRPVAGLRLGLALRPPGVRLWQSPDGYDLENGSTQVDPATGQTVYAPYFSDTPRGEHGSVMSTPFSLTLGVAWVQPGSFAIAIDADYTVPYSDDGLQIDDRGYFNGRIGAEVTIDPRFVLSFGAFTDVSPLRNDPRFQDYRVDYRLDFFGASAALTILTPYDITGSEKTTRLTFCNTIGVKYAYGFGTVGGLLLDPAGTLGGPPASEVVADAHQHDFSIILASSLLF